VQQKGRRGIPRARRALRATQRGESVDGIWPRRIRPTRRWTATSAAWQLDRRARTVSLDERYALREWKAPLRLNFMTPLRVDVSRPARFAFAPTAPAHRYAVRYDATRFDATSEEIPIADARLLPVWGNRLARVVLVSKDKGLRGEHRLTIGYAP
jgi:hypothetical protein